MSIEPIIEAELVEDSQLVRRKRLSFEAIVWMIVIGIALTGLGFVGGLAGFFMNKKQFESSAKVHIRRVNEGVSSVNHARELVSDEHLRKTIRYESLASLPEYGQFKDSEMLQTIKSNLFVERIDDENLYQIRFRSMAPEAARIVLTSIVDHYRDSVNPEKDNAPTRSLSEVFEDPSSGNTPNPREQNFEFDWMEQPRDGESTSVSIPLTLGIGLGIGILASCVVNVLIFLFCRK